VVAVTREWGLRLLFFLIGAAVGAAVTGVSWTWWATWAVAVAAWFRVAFWHRNGHAHA